MRDIEINENELETLSQQELEALEDQVVAAEETAEAESSTESQAENKANDLEGATGTGDSGSENVSGDKAADAEDKKSEGETKESVVTDDSKETQEDDITKHVSPPSKWVAKRQAARETKEAIAHAKAVEAENAALKQRLELIESRLASKGDDIKFDPNEVLSPERIANVRAEFGDEVADMFQAVRNLQSKTAVDNSDYAESTVNVELEAAIDDNDELSYWRQNSEELWNKAIDVNDELLKNPEYAKLTFAERMYNVVEKVKADVVAEAKNKATDKQEQRSNEPPPSLSGDLGAAETITEKSIVDRVLAAEPAEAEKIYRNASVADREKIDVALEI